MGGDASGEAAHKTASRIPLCTSGQVIQRLADKCLAGLLCVAQVQRDYEDLLAVLIVSPVDGNGRLPTDRKGSGQVPIWI